MITKSEALRLISQLEKAAGKLERLGMKTTLAGYNSHGLGMAARQASDAADKLRLLYKLDGE